MPTASTFTNKIDTDKSLVHKGRLESPTKIIKFTKSQEDWFTIWDSNVIALYNKEHKPAIAMRPYLDERYTDEGKNTIIEAFNMRVYTFKDLITFKQFQQAISLLKPSR